MRSQSRFSVIKNWQLTTTFNSRTAPAAQLFLKTYSSAHRYWNSCERYQLPFKHLLRCDSRLERPLLFRLNARGHPVDYVRERLQHRRLFRVRAVERHRRQPQPNGQRHLDRDDYVGWPSVQRHAEVVSRRVLGVSCTCCPICCPLSDHFVTSEMCVCFSSSFGTYCKAVHNVPFLILCFYAAFSI